MQTVIYPTLYSRYNSLSILGLKLIQFTKSLMTELFVGKNTGAEPLCLGIYVYNVNMLEINCKHIVMADLTWWCIFIRLTTRPSTDGKRAPLTAISLQVVAAPRKPRPHISQRCSSWKKLEKKSFFSQNDTEINSDDWIMTKKDY